MRVRTDANISIYCQTPKKREVFLQILKVSNGRSPYRRVMLTLFVRPIDHRQDEYRKAAESIHDDFPIQEKEVNFFFAFPELVLTFAAEGAVR